MHIIIANHFKMKQEEISCESSVDSIGDWDSLEHIKLILKIESGYKVKFSLEVIPRLTSVKIIQEELEKLTHE